MLSCKITKDNLTEHTSLFIYALFTCVYTIYYIHKEAYIVFQLFIYFSIFVTMVIKINMAL